MVNAIGRPQDGFSEKHGGLFSIITSFCLPIPSLPIHSIFSFNGGRYGSSYRHSTWWRRAKYIFRNFWCCYGSHIDWNQSFPANIYLCLYKRNLIGYFGTTIVEKLRIYQIREWILIRTGIDGYFVGIKFFPPEAGASISINRELLLAGTIRASLIISKKISHNPRVVFHTTLIFLSMGFFKEILHIYQSWYIMALSLSSQYWSNSPIPKNTIRLIPWIHRISIRENLPYWKSH